MLLTICERIEDARGDVDATHGTWIVGLSTDGDPGRRMGYATVSVLPDDDTVRLDGVAVVRGTGWAPDPIQIRIVDHGETSDQDPRRITVLRTDLPVRIFTDGLRGVARVRRVSSPYDEIPPALDDARPVEAVAEEE